MCFLCKCSSRVSLLPLRHHTCSARGSDVQHTNNKHTWKKLTHMYSELHTHFGKKQSMKQSSLYLACRMVSCLKPFRHNARILSAPFHFSSVGLWKYPGGMERQGWTQVLICSDIRVFITLQFNGFIKPAKGAWLLFFFSFGRIKLVFILCFHSES